MLEYDGLFILTEIDKSQETLNLFNDHLEPLLKQTNLFPMTFEQK